MVRNRKPAHPSKGPARILGIAGTAGKTGTRALAARALAPSGPTKAPAAFTLVEMPFAAAGTGPEVPFDAILVTEVGPRDLVRFAGADEIAAAVARSLAALKAGGTAILPGESPAFPALEAAAKAAGARDVLTFGTGKGCDLCLCAAQVAALRTEVEAEIEGRALSFSIPQIGAHWALDALAVLGAAAALGADLADAVNALETAPAEGRGCARELPWGEGRIVLLDERGGNEPLSMAAALRALAAAANLPQLFGSGRAVAVLEAMPDLGAASDACHADLGALFKSAALDRLFVAGAPADPAFTAAPEAVRAARAKRPRDLIKPLLIELRPGDVVLVKGGKAMDAIVAALETHSLNGTTEA